MTRSRQRWRRWRSDSILSQSFKRFYLGEFWTYDRKSWWNLQLRPFTSLSLTDWFMKTIFCGNRLSNIIIIHRNKIHGTFDEHFFHPAWHFHTWAEASGGLSICRCIQPRSASLAAFGANGSSLRHRRSESDSSGRSP